MSVIDFAAYQSVLFGNDF